MTHVFHGVDEFRAAAGLELRAGDWFAVTQDRIDAFADVTEDWQWIHVDPQRAASSDMGSTVAHGYLTLSLLPRLSSGLFTFERIGRAINYGLDKVRFPSYVRPGDRIRAVGRVAWTREARAGGVLACVHYSIEVEGSDTPACIAESLMVAFPPGA
ncbi:MaoC family dehydratase [Dietzia sp. SLG310A2-38A2]|uniref:MaoC family dehydratase n=1 Tax=Dietzia sp. SLG310A2-38A2 TaxID=1630643 RepID=UPI0015FB28E4|nr:MaoC family dehydratase [Dietzia sp. SLG310A2-38A2]MBB1029986.1 MaoC family dehydratase [Dietzia sp. SLG310A2-38A2]